VCSSMGTLSINLGRCHASSLKYHDVVKASHHHRSFWGHESLYSYQLLEIIYGLSCSLWVLFCTSPSCSLFLSVSWPMPPSSNLFILVRLKVTVWNMPFPSTRSSYALNTSKYLEISSRNIESQNVLSWKGPKRIMESITVSKMRN